MPSPETNAGAAPYRLPPAFDPIEAALRQLFGGLEDGDIPDDLAALAAQIAPREADER